MKVQFNTCTLDEFSIGIFTGYGNDEHGDHWFIEIGFILFQISICKYMIV